MLGIARAQLGVVSAIAIALIAACGGERTGASAGGGVAGKVLSLEGQVTATRAAAGSPARPLAAADSVYADDTIATAEGASITIELAHNGARWSLTGGVSRRVDRSPAWRAKRGGDELLGSAGGDRTAAAGRHAEREAAEPAPDMEAPPAAEPEPLAEVPEPIDDVVALPRPKPTAPAKTEAPPATAPPPPPPPPPPPAPEPEPTPDPDGERERERAKRSSKRNMAPPKDIEKGPVGDDPLDGLLDSEPKRKKLTRAEVLEAIAKIRGDIATCSEKHDGKGKKVTVAFVVTSAGKVSRADARGEHADSALGRCVVRAVKKARFPSGRETTPITFPFRL